MQLHHPAITNARNRHAPRDDETLLDDLANDTIAVAPSAMRTPISVVR